MYNIILISFMTSTCLLSNFKLCCVPESNLQPHWSQLWHNENHLMWFCILLKGTVKIVLKFHCRNNLVILPCWEIGRYKYDNHHNVGIINTKTGAVIENDRWSRDQSSTTTYELQLEHNSSIFQQKMLSIIPSINRTTSTKCGTYRYDPWATELN